MSEGSSILSSGPKRQYGTLESTNASQNPHIIYNIKPGDTLVSIAVQFGTTLILSRLMRSVGDFLRFIEYIMHLLAPTKQVIAFLNIDYRLPEIIADCDPSKRDCFPVTSLSVSDETVVMVTAPSTSKLNSITDSRKRFCSIPTNSIHDPC
ncbi:unnamed protein product [Schistosoma mattheei]|uniref:Uncharacterized protein n=1 Tax=Schistosoma mattheei TaxID=31246 RepID=A0A183NSS6_9TREM|nr:unnamed protein product [Schistosoma mattheei]